MIKLNKENVKAVSTEQLQIFVDACRKKGYIVKINNSYPYVAVAITTQAEDHTFTFEKKEEGFVLLKDYEVKTFTLAKYLCEMYDMPRPVAPKEIKRTESGVEAEFVEKTETGEIKKTFITVEINEEEMERQKSVLHQKLNEQLDVLSDAMSRGDKEAADAAQDELRKIKDELKRLS